MYVMSVQGLKINLFKSAGTENKSSTLAGKTWLLRRKPKMDAIAIRRKTAIFR
jgi:hypothetical protein